MINLVQEPTVLGPALPQARETILCDPQRCTDCGADLAGAAVTGTARRQVTDVRPPPPPWVTEYRVITRACPRCAARTRGKAPAVVTGRARCGPGVLARAAQLLCGHYLPVVRAATRAALNLAATAGVSAAASRPSPVGQRLRCATNLSCRRAEKTV
jgi:transposase